MVNVKVKDGKTYSVEVGSQLIDNVKIPIPYSCEQGYCGSCLIRVLSGKIEGQQEPFLKETKADPDMRLGCQCFITEDVEIEISP